MRSGSATEVPPNFWTRSTAVKATGDPGTPTTDSPGTFCAYGPRRQARSEEGKRTSRTRATRGSCPAPEAHANGEERRDRAGPLRGRDHPAQRDRRREESDHGNDDR